MSKFLTSTRDVHTVELDAQPDNIFGVKRYTLNLSVHGTTVEFPARDGEYRLDLPDLWNWDRDTIEGILATPVTELVERAQDRINAILSDDESAFREFEDSDFDALRHSRRTKRLASFGGRYQQYVGVKYDNGKLADIDADIRAEGDPNLLWPGYRYMPCADDVYYAACEAFIDENAVEVVEGELRFRDGWNGEYWYTTSESEHDARAYAL